MLASVRKVYETHSLQRPRLKRFFQKLGNLAGRLTPYFEVVNIFVQSNPQYASLVWGTLRFIFQLGTNYVGFMETFGSMFEKIEISLPAFEAYVSVLKARADKRGQPLSSSLIKALTCVYVDLVKFCQDIFKLLGTKRGSRFRTVTILKDLCWKPFDIRFAEFIRSFNQHATILEQELCFDHASKVLEEFELLSEKMSETERHLETLKLEMSSHRQRRESKQEKEAADDSIRRLLRWINPPGWQQPLEDATGRLLPGTCEWFFDEPGYQEWERGQKPNTHNSLSLLLVQGKPGFGKTHLCASLIRHLTNNIEPDKEAQSDYGSSHPAFYFFDRQQPQTCQPISGFRAVLGQLLQANVCNREIIDLACLAMGVNSYPYADAHLEATKDSILGLLNMVLQRLGGATLIFDGVDECADTQGFFHCISKATENAIDNTDGPIKTQRAQARTDIWAPTKTMLSKVALFSRPDLKVPRAFVTQAACIQLRPHQNLTDISAFVSSRLQQLIDEGLMEEHIDLARMARSAAGRADGMFLWAKLLINYLECDAFTCEDRVGALNNLVLFEGLDQ
ncbi:hypothetical protein AOQ84DRAFT_322474, partial [Glonium stellatum]